MPTPAGNLPPYGDWGGWTPPPPVSPGGGSQGGQQGGQGATGDGGSGGAVGGGGGGGGGGGTQTGPTFDPTGMSPEEIGAAISSGYRPVGPGATKAGTPKRDDKEEDKPKPQDTKPVDKGETINFTEVLS